MAKGVTIIIPARLEASRFPGKVLYKYREKPLLYYVWRSMTRCRTVQRVVIATDNRRIAAAANEFGAETVMTSRRHRTGTDRVAEAAAKVGGQIIINVQADNLGLRPTVVDRVVRAMQSDRSITCATLARPVADARELNNPDIVKVVKSPNGFACWFSRSPLPWLRGIPSSQWPRRFRYLAHLGVYFFRPAALESFAQQRRTPLEKAESLEQLRILEHGGRIRLFVSRVETVSVDRQSDLKKLKNILHVR